MGALGSDHLQDAKKVSAAGTACLQEWFRKRHQSCMVYVAFTEACRTSNKHFFFFIMAIAVYRQLYLYANCSNNCNTIRCTHGVMRKFAVAQSFFCNLENYRKTNSPFEYL